jgi:mannose-6-phosphate isomerase-like protein (cupin superfamily)
MIFHENIEKNTIKNKNYRNVVYTGKKLQFVYMSLKPLDNIHKEIHKTHDQFIRVESGNGIAIIENKKYKLKDGIGLIIPAGKIHEIKNTSSKKELKLYTIYAPPEHRPNLIVKINPDKDN